MDTDNAWVGEFAATIPTRLDWLRTHHEAPLEIDIPILDAHHHLWERDTGRYWLNEFLDDVAGNNVQASVYMECTSKFLPDGPDWLKPVGETRAVMDLTKDLGAEAACKVAAGIVAFADLTRGDRAIETLEAHKETAGDRFVGVRHMTIWHEDSRIRMDARAPKPKIRPGMMTEASFHAGFACLGRLGLVFDCWLYHTQLEELIALAKRFPHTVIVIDHIGGPIRVGAADAAETSFRAWSASLRKLAQFPNIRLKIGGFGMGIAGGGWARREQAPSSEALAAAWRTWIEEGVEIFSPQRCMFESNFPVDKGSFGYTELWNAFKRVSRQYSASDRAALFHKTAAATYNIAF